MCIAVPMPWPTYSSTMPYAARPAASARGLDRVRRCRRAGPRREPRPGRAHSASSVTRDSSARLGPTSPTRDRDRGVAVPAVDDRAAVDGDQVALAQDPVARDAVHDLVVDRGADRRPGSRGSPGTTASRRGRGSTSSAIASSSPVVTPGRDRGAQQLEGAGDHETGPRASARSASAVLISIAVLAAEHRAAPAQTPSAARIRAGDLVDRAEAVDLRRAGPASA